MFEDSRSPSGHGDNPWPLLNSTGAGGGEDGEMAVVNNPDRGDEGVMRAGGGRGEGLKGAERGETL